MTAPRSDAERIQYATERLMSDAVKATVRLRGLAPEHAHNAPRLQAEITQAICGLVYLGDGQADELERIERQVAERAEQKIAQRNGERITFPPIPQAGPR